MLELVIAVLILIVASALCSGTEAAIFSLPITKSRQLAEKGANGKIVHSIRERPARPISVIVLFNNVANIIGTYFVAYLATAALTGKLQTWFPFLLTMLVIVFSEIVPKTVGERFCVPVATFMARPLWYLTWLLTPVVWGIEVFTSLLIGKKSTQITSEGEIRALSRIAEQEGIIDEDESHMIGRIFELDDVTAENIMTPRTALTWIRGCEPLSVAKLKIGQGQHSRTLVVGETIDEVLGVILKSTVLRLVVEGHDENDLVEDHIEPVKLVKEATPADELLAYFKNSRVHLAVVVDEYGGVSGIVTLEDVLEVLTGEIVDETDIAVDMQDVARENGVKRYEEQGIPEELLNTDGSGNESS
jgi:CBS domain containing-hemolysin-like protein